MKSFVILISLAIFMATSSFAGNTNFNGKPGDGDKLKTTVKCGHEKGKRPKSYTKKNKRTVSINFTKKQYHHTKKRR